MKIKVWVGKRRVRVRDTAIKINNTRRQTYRSGLFRSTASAELEEFPWLAYKLTRGRQTTLAYPLFPGFWSSFRVVRTENFEHTHTYTYINIQVSWFSLLSVHRGTIQKTGARCARNTVRKDWPSRMNTSVGTSNTANEVIPFPFSLFLSFSL